MDKLNRLYTLLTTRVLDRLQSPLLLVLRLFIGWRFFMTGWGKLHHIDGVIEFFTSLGIPMPAVNAWFVASLELVGGALLFIGLASRLIAIPLSINMIVAYLTADREAVVNIFKDPDAFMAAAPFAFLLVSLIVLAFGPGAFSIDYLIRKRIKVPPQLATAAIVLLMFAMPAHAARLEKATFAGGCFWCMEPPFEKTNGVVQVISGYTGGTKVNPTYDQVSLGGTGHREAVEVLFDPKKVSYAKLLDVFWHNVDPTDPEGQFCDKGQQYLAAIYYHGPEQQRLATASLEAVKKKFAKVWTDVLPAGAFYRAEDYHQDYYKKNPIRYRFYRSGCGRDARLEEVWK